MTPLQVADKAWDIIRKEGAVIEEAVEDNGSLKEKEDDMATKPADVAVSASFNEKSDGLDGYQVDAVNIHPDDHPPKDEGDGRGLL